MSVKRIREAPRITRPFSDESWARLDRLGEQVDADLESRRRAPDHGRRADLRFRRRPGIAGMEYRRGRADQARPRRRSDPAACATRFAPGGLLHYGQGKWYPGESLPRWAFGLYWRKDGVPIWKNSDLIATDRRPAQGRHRRRRAFRGRRGQKARRRFRIHHAGVRGSLALAAEGSRPAAECRSRQFQTVRSGRALAHGAGVRSGAQHAEGLRAADPALERRGQPSSALEAASAGNCGAAICS